MTFLGEGKKNNSEKQKYVVNIPQQQILNEIMKNSQHCKILYNILKFHISGIKTTKYSHKILKFLESFALSKLFMKWNIQVSLSFTVTWPILVSTSISQSTAEMLEGQLKAALQIWLKNVQKESCLIKINVNL